MKIYKVNSLKIIETDFENSFINNQKDATNKVLNKYMNYLVQENKYNKSLEKSLLSLTNILSSNRESKVLVNGQIQSGKTSFIFSLISLAVDLNYHFIFFLAGMTNILLNQSLERLKTIIKESKKVNIEEIKNLKNLNLYKEKDEIVIVTVLKEVQNLENLRSVFLSNNIIDEKILIIDDEADFASLNLQNNDEKFSKIHSIISLLYSNKKFISKYFAITGTPFANLLSFSNNNLYPQYFLNLKTSEEYTGIEFFEQENNIYEIIGQYTQDKQKIYDIILCFFITAALFNLIKNDDISNQFLFNIDLKKEEHKKLFEIIKNEINKMKNNFKLIKNFSKIKDKLMVNNSLNAKIQEIDASLLYKKFKKILFSFDLNKDLLILNSDNGCIVNEHNINEGIKIIIGGVMLSRGFTFENLLFEYIYNVPKKIIKLDTLLQRARWFGYRYYHDRYLFMKIFMPENAYNAYSEGAFLLKEIEKISGYNEVNNKNQIFLLRQNLIEQEKTLKLKNIELTMKKGKNENKTNFW